MSTRRAAIAALAILAAAALIELAMGRVPICTCGTVDLWVGERDSLKTSQMLTDWYSLSHAIHGFRRPRLCAEVDVGVDEPGDDEFAGSVNDIRTQRYRLRSSRIQIGDDPVANYDRPV